MERKYAEFAATKACELLAIDSPSGYTRKAADWVKEAFSSLGFDAQLTTKGGVLVNLGGADEKDALLLEAHTDTLGAMVAEVKANGRLRLTPLGGMRAENAETENVRVHTRTGRIIEGTVQLCNASVHVNGQYGETKRSFDTVEAVLDEDVKTADETRALGVEARKRRGEVEHNRSVELRRQGCFRHEKDRFNPRQRQARKARSFARRTPADCSAERRLHAGICALKNAPTKKPSLLRIASGSAFPVLRGRSEPVLRERLEQHFLRGRVRVRPPLVGFVRAVFDAPPVPFAESVVRPVPPERLENVDAVFNIEFAPLRPTHARKFADVNPRPPFFLESDDVLERLFQLLPSERTLRVGIGDGF